MEDASKGAYGKNPAGSSSSIILEMEPRLSFGISDGHATNEVIAEYHSAELECAIKKFSISNTDPFGKRLECLVVPLITEFFTPQHIGHMVSSREAYIAYLQAVHAAMYETCSFIDWELLESYGLPLANEHKSLVASMESELRALSGTPSYEYLPENSSVLPTCGVSIGMVFSLAEGARAARRTAEIAARVVAGLSIPGESAGNTEPTVQAPLGHSLVDWVNGLNLSKDDRDEALFAARACVEFSRRHFSNNQQ